MINSRPSCKNCIHFQNDPSLIEAAYSGLTALSSGFASVRDRDGFCNYHQLYLSARDRCPAFTPQPDTPTFSPSHEENKENVYDEASASPVSRSPPHSTPRSAAYDCPSPAFS